MTNKNCKGPSGEKTLNAAVNIKGNTIQADPATPEELQRSKWRDSTQHYRKRQKDNISMNSDIQAHGRSEGAAQIKSKANIALLDKNIECQRLYRLRNTTRTGMNQQDALLFATREVKVLLRSSQKLILPPSLNIRPFGFGKVKLCKF